MQVIMVTLQMMHPLQLLLKSLLEGESCDIPSITAKEGYNFVGWTVSGKQDSSLDASTTTFIPSELAFLLSGSGKCNFNCKI